jgi:hypothetical protein
MPKSYDPWGFLLHLWIKDTDVRVTTGKLTLAGFSSPNIIDAAIVVDI